MTGLIAIDESGDLGSAGSDYFAMASIVTSASRNLKKASSQIPLGKIEYKFFNTFPDKIHRILNQVCDSEVSINYIVTCKNNPIGHTFVYGNDLYRRTLADLVDSSMSDLQVRDVSIIVDGSRFISNDDLRKTCSSLANKYGKNLKKCYKGISQNEPCLKLADYVVGAIRMRYEHGDDTFLRDIEDKITIARRY